MVTEDDTTTQPPNEPTQMPGDSKEAAFELHLADYPENVEPTIIEGQTATETRGTWVMAPSMLQEAIEDYLQQNESQ